MQVWAKRSEDDRLLRGRGRFVANLVPVLAPDALVAVFVRAPLAHARVTAIHVDDARRMPGVVLVGTADDLGLEAQLPQPALLDQSMARVALARDTVRFAGEAVAIVVATGLAAALDAAELVAVDYEPLTAVVHVRDALRDDVLVHPAAGTNVALRFPATTGASDVAPRPVEAGTANSAPTDDAPVRVELVTRNQRVAIAPIEGRSMLAQWDGAVLTVHTSGQGPHPHRLAYAAALGLEPSQVHVICPDTGGAFGAKAMPYPEELVVAHVARLLGRPVVFTEGRTESMAALGHARAQEQRLVLHGTPDGRIVATDLHVVQDCGAYPRLGAFMPNMGRLMHTGPYAIASAAHEACSVVTNTNPTVAYRGAGGPEAAAIVERAVDLFAAQVGLDPIEVRRRNLVPVEAFPFTNAGGLVYDSGDYQRGLDALVDAVDLVALRADQQRRRDERATRQLGIGVACFVESCSTSNQPEHARVRIDGDGRVLVQSGTTPSGQGHETMWTQLVSLELGVPADRIRCETGDSAWFPTGTVTGGSRSVQVGGEAVRTAAVAALDDARRLAADLLEASIDDIVYDRGRATFHVQGAPVRGVALHEAAAAASGGCIDRLLRFDPASGTVSFGAYLAVVEVDLDTGATTLLRFVALDDAGTVINPTLFAGQVHGGVAQGIAQALYEEVVYDDDGTLRTSNLADYAMPGAPELPFIETLVVETPTPHNALGAKGVGESGPIGATPAVHNAVVDAVAWLGVDHIELPCTPQRVWEALRAARSDDASGVGGVVRG